jgi:hypothetical protein
VRHEIGVDRIMWGTDYPHTEGTYPYTRENLRLSFAGMEPAEIQQLVGGNAAKVYGFDMEKLGEVAARVGPTHAEIAVPLPYDQVPDEARKCPAFSAANQVV